MHSRGHLAARPGGQTAALAGRDGARSRRAAVLPSRGAARAHQSLWLKTNWTHAPRTPRRSTAMEFDEYAGAHIPPPCPALPRSVCFASVRLRSPLGSRARSLVCFIQPAKRVKLCPKLPSGAV
jgi:hypothetical protein